MTTVLVDGSCLRKRDQTGIFGYTRTLATTLHELGAEVSLLLGSPTGGSQSSDIALAGQVLGNAPERRGILRRLQLLQQTRFGWRRLTALRFVADDVDVASLVSPPALRDLRNAFPIARIRMVCGNWNRANAEASGLVDEVRTFNYFPENALTWDGRPVEDPHSFASAAEANSISRWTFDSTRIRVICSTKSMRGSAAASDPKCTSHCSTSLCRQRAPARQTLI